MHPVGLGLVAVAQWLQAVTPLHQQPRPLLPATRLFERFQRLAGLWRKVVAVGVQPQRYADRAIEPQVPEQWHGAMVPGAHGDTLFCQQVGDIGVVHAIDDETGQCHLGRAEQANSLAIGQATYQALVQAGFMGGHGMYVEAGQVVQGGAQADHPGNRRGAGFETQWRGAEAGALVVRHLHHFSAVLPVTQQRQRILAAASCCTSCRP
ncbi:hypothetical protein WR25_19839 [Diploscapter pachys]|uniref:Uncharacterized protein n=1 Tax=Diploscapter pachys TaxID=2018661 RepID=A0A2A2K4A3_9BILA|nr:hypothetical protein WR25_19839 [Diploscapter pachys]